MADLYHSDVGQQRSGKRDSTQRAMAGTGTGALYRLAHGNPETPASERWRRAQAATVARRAHTPRIPGIAVPAGTEIFSTQAGRTAGHMDRKTCRQVRSP